MGEKAKTKSALDLVGEVTELLEGRVELPTLDSDAVTCYHRQWTSWVVRRSVR